MLSEHLYSLELNIVEHVAEQHYKFLVKSNIVMQQTFSYGNEEQPNKSQKTLLLHIDSIKRL